MNQLHIGPEELRLRMGTHSLKTLTPPPKCVPSSLPRTSKVSAIQVHPMISECKASGFLQLSYYFATAVCFSFESFDTESHYLDIQLWLV